MDIRKKKQTQKWFFLKNKNWSRIWSRIWWGLKLNWVTPTKQRWEKGSFLSLVVLCFWMFVTSHPAVSSLSCVWNQDRPFQLSRTQDGPPLAQSEDGVPALQRRFGEETCSRESRSFTCHPKHVFQFVLSGRWLVAQPGYCPQEPLMSRHLISVFLCAVCVSNTPSRATMTHLN